MCAALYVEKIFGKYTNTFEFHTMLKGQDIQYRLDSWQDTLFFQVGVMKQKCLEVYS